MIKAGHSRPRIFYGWWLVLVCLLVQGIVTGVSLYSYSVFAGEVETAFSSSRAMVMLAMTGQSIMIALASPVLGNILDRASIKWTIMVTALIMGLGFLAISLAQSVWGFVAGSLAPLAAGWLFDATGSYHALFTALILLIVPALLCIPLIKRREPRTQSTFIDSGAAENEV